MARGDKGAGGAGTWLNHDPALATAHNASFRMVLGYWDMAASLVTTGAVDLDTFLAAHAEIVTTFSKIHPFLAELRTVTAEPEFCKHVEAVVLAAPDAEAILARRRAAASASASGPHSRVADRS